MRESKHPPLLGLSDKKVLLYFFSLYLCKLFIFGAVVMFYACQEIDQDGQETPADKPAPESVNIFEDGIQPP